MPTWGLAATIKAPVAETLHFAAYHIEAGAHRLYIYLDDANAEAYQHLKAHPKVRPVMCDADWWQGKRPKKHQVRQSQNATHAYHRKAEVDWLIHMDVDEFLVPAGTVAEALAALPADQPIARLRPMEQLAGDGTHFKAFIPNGPDRAHITEALYPTFGARIKGGFLSHLAGKVFARTGLPDIKVQIHNVFQAGEMLTGPEDTAGINLAHCHAKTWEDWLAAFHFRMEQGSYRSELAPNKPPAQGGVTLHNLFAKLHAVSGDAGLRRFFDEVVADTPQLRKRLAEHGFLRVANLGLNATLDAHFPGFRP